MSADTKQPSNPHHGYPVSLHLRLDWSEMDKFGHINNVMFMKYIQASRVNYWEHTGIDRLFEETGIGPMLASVTCNYKKELKYPGSLKVLACMGFIGNSSFGFSHLLLDADGDVVAEASDVMVMYDFNRKEKVNFPETIRKKVEELEKRAFPAQPK